MARSPDTKAAIVERFIRTIKERTWRYFTHKNTRRYVDVLQKIIEAYNHTKNSATKMIPASVTLYNAAKARENLQQRYGNHTIRSPKCGVGNFVSISHTLKQYCSNIHTRFIDTRGAINIFSYNTQYCFNIASTYSLIFPQC